MVLKTILGLGTGGKSARARDLGINKLLYHYNGKNLIENIISRVEAQHPSKKVDNIIFTMRSTGDQEVDEYLMDFCEKNPYAHIVYGDHQGLGGAYFSVAEYADKNGLDGEIILSPGDTMIRDYHKLIGGDDIKIAIVDYNPKDWKKRYKDGEYARVDIFSIPEMVRPRFVELYKYITDYRPTGSIDRFGDIKTNYAFDILRNEFSCKNVHIGEVVEINLPEHVKDVESFLLRNKA